jgi:hypothetical protein
MNREARNGKRGSFRRFLAFFVVLNLERRIVDDKDKKLEGIPFFFFGLKIALNRCV